MLKQKRYQRKILALQDERWDNIVETLEIVNHIMNRFKTFFTKGPGLATKLRRYVITEQAYSTTFAST